MGHFRHPYIQAANTFSHFFNSNKIIRFLFSFSLLSVILSHSSLLPFLLDSYHIHVSTFPLKPFSYTIGKNYVFLLCNGLLFFIVKNSGLVGNNSSLGRDDLDEECVMENGDIRPSELGVSENKASDGSENALPEVEEEEERANGTLIALGEGDNGLILAMHDEDEEQDNGQLVIIKEEEGNGLELLSTEELNKIFDDFIRKKKEEMKFGGQQLIVV